MTSAPPLWSIDACHGVLHADPGGCEAIWPESLSDAYGSWLDGCRLVWGDLASEAGEWVMLGGGALGFVNGTLGWMAARGGAVQSRDLLPPGAPDSGRQALDAAWGMLASMARYLDAMDRLEAALNAPPPLDLSALADAQLALKGWRRFVTSWESSAAMRFLSDVEGTMGGKDVDDGLKSLRHGDDVAGLEAALATSDSLVSLVDLMRVPPAVSSAVLDLPDRAASDIPDSRNSAKNAVRDLLWVTDARRAEGFSLLQGGT